MYKLKSIARRTGLLLSAFGVVAGTFASFGGAAFADALNPLTERSLTLSSSAPGWDHTDGSGNTTYAAPNSGANGQKTGNTFQFKVSTDSSSSNAVNAFSFQYCTNPAGTCTAPGNDGTVGGVRNADDATAHSDLNVVSADSGTATGEIDNATDGIVTTGAVTGSGSVSEVPKADGSQGHYIVLQNNGTDASPNWVQSSGWTMAVGHNEDGQTLGTTSPATPGAGPTGRNNFITLVNNDGMSIAAGKGVKVIFFGTNDSYITNPGAGAFFVKINDYTDPTDPAALDGSSTATALTGATLLDGGVTVANVMNLSIEIQTKVLETMSFSVGTVDPDTLDDTQLSTATSGGSLTHTVCDPMLTAMSPTDPQNTLLLGNADAENSLSTDHTYSTHSYFRLSSNASAGATVYYAGNTLSNTEGDKIQPIGPTKAAPTKGAEQFGLALDTLGQATGTPSLTNPNYAVDYSVERAAGHVFESGADDTASGIAAEVAGTSTSADPGTDVSYDNDLTDAVAKKVPSLQVATGPTTTSPTGEDLNGATSLAPATNYNQGSGVVNGGQGYTQSDGTTQTVNTKFAFDNNSDQIPVPLATEDQSVVDCASGKIRYIANIAATTPAGIYTTKVNYIAAPQY